MNRQQTTAASPKDQRDSRYRFIIGGLTVLLNLSLGLSIPAVSPIMPLIMDDYAISRGVASLLTGLVILIMSGFAIPAGMLVGRVGLKKLIGAAWLMAAAPTLSFMAGTFPILLGLRLVFGLSFAIALPALGPLLMQWFRPRELPLINGLIMAAMTVGMTLSMFIVAPLATAVGWKAAMSILGSVPLVGAFFWICLARVQRFGQAQHGLSFRGTWAVLRSRITLLLAAGDAGPFAQYVALTTWLPTFYHEVHGMSLNAAGSAVGLVPLTGVVVLPLVGLLSMRVSRRRPFLIVAGIIGGIAGFGSFLLGGSAAAYPALLLLGVGNWLYLALLFTIPMELPDASPEEVSMMFAAIVTMGGILSFISPVTVGVLTDALGSYIPGFSIFGILSWSLVVAGLLLPETGPSVATAE